MAKKLTIEFIKSKFKEENYIPEFTEYINNYTKLNYICPKGHKHSINWSNWNSGKRCPYCAGQGKPSIDEIIKLFEKENYIPEFTEYINAHTKLDYTCPNGHRHSITLSNWNQGYRCPYCCGNIKYKIDYIKDIFKDDDYILLSENYKNAHTKLNYICPKGHDHSMTWGHWRAGTRCPSCAGKFPINLDHIKDSFNKNNYIVSSTEYTNSKTPLNVLCSEGHDYKVSWNNWSSKGHRCPKCSEWGTSKFEKEVKKFIVSLNQDIIENDRSTIMGNKGKFLELDILLPCKTKAIECNGIYWHSFSETMERDKIKGEQCKELGINLLVITDEEWEINQEGCKDILVTYIFE